MTLRAATREDPWWALDAKSVVRRLDTDLAHGLPPDEIVRRLEQVGPNELAEEPGRAPLLIFGAQFANTMIVVLLIAAAVTVAIGDLKDAIVISDMRCGRQGSEVRLPNAPAEVGRKP